MKIKFCGADRTVTGIYDRHEYLAEKRQALETWGDHLENLVDQAREDVDMPAA